MLLLSKIYHGGFSARDGSFIHQVGNDVMQPSTLGSIAFSFLFLELSSVLFVPEASLKISNKNTVCSSRLKYFSAVELAFQLKQWLWCGSGADVQTPKCN